MNPIGIMQGRLSPAGARAQSFPAAWREEFTTARAIGFDAIEWLVTATSLENNPLLVDPRAIVAAMQASGIAVPSICADFCIELPMVGVAAPERDRAQGHLRRVIDGAAQTGTPVVTVPLLEGNAVAGAAELAALLTDIASVIAHADASGVRLAFETDLPSSELAGSDIAVCYDIGNAAAIGADAAAELLKLRDRVAAVHLKDRRRNGSSVPLGEGDADFAGVFASLRTIGYDGALILETPRGTAPVDAARSNLDFIRRQLTEAAAPA
jgi:hexulose-6-phosphate isomerase